MQRLTDPDLAEQSYENAYQATFVALNFVKSSKNAWEQAGVLSNLRKRLF